VTLTGAGCSACRLALPVGVADHASRRWQGRFKSPAVEVETYFLNCARYIERNPLAAGLVRQPWDYRWSSCPAYALGVQQPLLSYNVWYRDLGPDATRRQQRWRQFLLGEDPNEEAVRQGDWEAAACYREAIRLRPNYQQHLDDWPGVFARIADALRQRLAANRP